MGSARTLIRKENRLTPESHFTEEEQARWPLVMGIKQGNKNDAYPIEGTINRVRYTIPKGVPSRQHPAVVKDVLKDNFETRPVEVPDPKDPRQTMLEYRDLPRHALTVLDWGDYSPYASPAQPEKSAEKPRRTGMAMMR